MMVGKTVSEHLMSERRGWRGRTRGRPRGEEGEEAGKTGLLR